MRILITGGKGMLGRTLEKEFSMHEIIIADLPEFDILNIDNIFNFILDNKPDVIIHCAAMTNVDLCETQIDLAYNVNAIGTKNIATICNKLNIKLIYISTDYVFNGESSKPYNEFDIPNGGNTIYGKSKFAGEEYVKEICTNYIIARVSWLYGNTGPSFVHAMLNLAKTHDKLYVVNDQIGNPTSTKAVADMLLKILDKYDLTGIFHLTCEGTVSWYDFAKQIFKIKNINCEVIPCNSNEFKRLAQRPNYSSLDKMMLRLNNFPEMQNWKDALYQFLTNEFKE